MTDSQKRLFEFVTREVWDAGGDGDGTVVLHKTPVKEMADAFEKWMRTDRRLSKWPYERFDRQGYVLFSDRSNENIIFVSKTESEKFRTTWRQEVWVEVW